LPRDATQEFQPNGNHTKHNTMKGFRFYLEYDTPSEKSRATVKEPGNHSGNVLAVRIGSNDAIGAATYTRNGGVCSVTYEEGHLRAKCKRIPEKLARDIHPSLFSVLDHL
jgi:hypothetical protein